MGCSSLDQPDGGFATASAMMVSAALALVASASVGAALSELGRSRAQLQKAQAEYALDGVQRAAAFALMQDGAPGRLSWSLTAAGVTAKVLAEPEASKVGLGTAAMFDDQALAGLGVTDADTLRRRLKAAADDPRTAVWVADLDDAPAWRACAASLISPYGRAHTVKPAPAAVPGRRGSTSHVGEVWRIRASTAAGWVDERVLRFTGDLLDPTATIERRFARTREDETRCERTRTPHAA